MSRHGTQVSWEICLRGRRGVDRVNLYWKVKQDPVGTRANIFNNEIWIEHRPHCTVSGKKRQNKLL